MNTTEFGDLCSRCMYRKESIEAMAQWKAANYDGMLCDPAPKAECKRHRGYGVRPPETRAKCRDFKPVEVRS